MGHLHVLPNDKLVLPQCTRDNERRVWMTCPIGSGSTGNVWECHFDGSDYNELYAIKVVEVLHRSDEDKRKRLRDEFNVYLLLEDAYLSGKLHDRIAPRCYSAFGSDCMDVIILDRCDNSLKAWHELNPSERGQLYQLVHDLHRMGLMHGDLEPRNVVRIDGGLRLIDFSQSQKHICTESKVDKLQRSDLKCRELQMLRCSLPHPLEADLLNVKESPQ